MHHDQVRSRRGNTLDQDDCGSYRLFDRDGTGSFECDDIFTILSIRTYLLSLDALHDRF